MLSMFNESRKLRSRPSRLPPVEYMEAEPAEPVRRMKQQNIKASEDCCAALRAIAEALDMSKAELFEDMVAGKLEELANGSGDL